MTGEVYHSIEYSPAYAQPIITPWVVVDTHNSGLQKEYVFCEVVFDWEKIWAPDPASARRLTSAEAFDVMYGWEELVNELRTWPYEPLEQPKSFDEGTLYYEGIRIFAATLFPCDASAVANTVRTLRFGGVREHGCGQGKLSFSLLTFRQGDWALSHERLWRIEHARKRIKHRTELAQLLEYFAEQGKDFANKGH